MKFSVKFEERSTTVEVTPTNDPFKVKVSLIMPGCGCEPHFTANLSMPFDQIDKDALKDDLIKFTRTQIKDFKMSNGKTAKVNYCPWCGYCLDEATFGVNYATA